MTSSRGVNDVKLYLINYNYKLKCKQLSLRPVVGNGCISYTLESTDT